MMRALILLTLLYFVGPSKAFAAERCAGLFTFDGSIKALAELRLTIDLAQVEGRNSVEFTALTADYTNKEKELLRHLEKNNIMTREELLVKIKGVIARLQKDRLSEIKKQARDDQEAERKRKKQTREIESINIDFRKANFNKISPGQFQMGDQGAFVSVTITKAFEMAATPTTQFMWKQIVLLGDKKSIPSHMDPHPSANFGETHPVEQVSYLDIENWLAVLNELSRRGSPELKQIIPSHKKGDRYRLPTEAEWEFVIRGRGTDNEIYHFGADAKQLSRYAWYDENSDGMTQAVGQKLPLNVDGKDFYDMHGNVREWVQDNYEENLRGGVDPQGAPSTREDMPKVYRGGGFSNSAKRLRSGIRFQLPPDESHPGQGFRLVREVRP